MCGIVGYIGNRSASDVIVNGLQRLEYRGYDSAGVAVLQDDRIELRRAVGKLNNLQKLVHQHPLNSHIGIGHTRWATHGQPSVKNAHPHVSMCGDYVIVHNGIVENYQEIRSRLMQLGITFQSQTDSEVIAQLIAVLAKTGLSFVEAVRCAVKELQGAHGIVVLNKNQPDTLIAVRIGNAGGVVIGQGEDEIFLASDIPAIHCYSENLVFLESQQMAIITATQYHLQTLSGEAITPRVHHIPFDPEHSDKGEYTHYMQKEIFEQARTLTDTLRGRIDLDQADVLLPEMNLTADQAQQLRQLYIVACGTSYYSGLVGKFYMEQLARLRTDVDYGSEIRYRNPLLDQETALLAITQSGETVDTLAGIEEGREKGATIWSIVNAVGSQAMRIADGSISMNVGAEVGVASTKAFTASLVDQYLLALKLATLRQTITLETRQQALQDLLSLPNLVGRALELNPTIEAISAHFARYKNFLYIGRGINYPIALEGALKLKEISYIHAEGYPAGEMKHGPIALIDNQMPVVAIATQDHLYEKMISQIEQAKARGAIVIALATEGDKQIHSKADFVIEMPPTPYLLSPIVNVVPLQLLAYQIANRRGANVDQPRNLAKSVTVE